MDARGFCRQVRRGVVLCALAVGLATGWGCRVALAAEVATTRRAELREELDKRILALIDELESPDPSMRQKAMETMSAIGPRACELLRKLLDAPATPEFKTRARQLIEEITRTWHLSAEGGEVMGGFQAILRPAGTEYVAGGPILVSLEMRNISPQARMLTDIRAFDVELGRGGGVFRSDFSDARLVIRMISQGKMPQRGVAIVYEKGPPRKIEFRRGGSISTGIRVDDAVELPAGEYDVQVVYYAKAGNLADAYDDLRSNVLRVRVETK